MKEPIALTPIAITTSTSRPERGTAAKVIARYCQVDSIDMRSV